MSLDDREWIANYILTKNKKTKKSINGDLRLLRLFLASWDFKEKSLSQLTETDILSQLKQHYYINELSREEGLVEVLSNVTSIFQFDVPFYARRTKMRDTIFLVEYLDKLRKKGLVKFIGQGKYILSHSLDAYYLNKCLASLQQEEDEIFTAQNVIQYLHELPKIPKERISENIFGVFKGFFGTNPGDFDGKQVFGILFEEINDFIFNNLVHYHIGIITYSLQYLNRIEGKDKALTFWKSIMNRYDKDFWLTRISESDALTVSILCMNIGKINIHEASSFFNSYLRQEKIHSDFLNGGNLITLNHFIRNLNDETIEIIITELSKDKFAKGLVSTKSITNTNLILAKFTRLRSGRKFLKEAFTIVQEDYFEEYKVLFLKIKSLSVIRRLREYYNTIGMNAFRLELEQDARIKEHMDNIRKQSMDARDGSGKKE